MISEIILFILLLLAIFGRKLLYLGSDVHRLAGPSAWPIIGSLFAFTVTPEGVIPIIQEFQRKYGNIFLIWVGYIPVVNVISPEGAEAILNCKRNIKKGRAYKSLEPWLGQGLLTSDGSRWHSHRKLITPTFHFSTLDTFLDIFQDHADTLTARLAAASAATGPVHLYPYITTCTLDIISEAAMGVKINAQRDMGENAGSKDTQEYIQSVFRVSQLTMKRILNPLLRPAFIFYNTEQGKSYRRHLETLHGFTNKVIRSRMGFQSTENADKKRLAFLDLLLKVRDKNGRPLTQQDIREEVDTFMFEGHDTTAAAIVWILYLLAQNPAIQQQIYQEIQETLPCSRSGDPVTTAHLSRLNLLERSIKEALRLFPSVPNITRNIVDDIEIDGYKIPAGAAIIVHIYQLHRDPHIFPDPEKFHPDRFLPEHTVGRHPFAYIPFSGGLRNCIGQKFAMLEEKTILLSILRIFEVEAVGELDRQRVRTELTLRPPKELTFRLKHRQSDI